MPTQRAFADALDERSRAEAISRIDPILEAFVAEHYPRLVRLTFLICGNSADAADAVQRGLELAWRQRAALRDESRLRPWLDRAVVREAIRLARRPWLRRVLSLDAASTRIEWIDPVGEDTTASPEWLALRTAFDRLPSEQRAVVALHLYAGYSVMETAAIVDAPVETVRSRLRIAKERLRRELGERTR
jgi:RNA polymerase sigma factor (sigma-70 family)